MSLAHQIPMELINKILIMRPTHPSAKCIDFYARWVLLDATENETYVATSNFTLKENITNMWYDAFKHYKLGNLSTRHSFMIDRFNKLFYSGKERYPYKHLDLFTHLKWIDLCYENNEINDALSCKELVRMENCVEQATISYKEGDLETCKDEILEFWDGGNEIF